MVSAEVSFWTPRLGVPKHCVGRPFRWSAPRSALRERIRSTKAVITINVAGVSDDSRVRRVWSGPSTLFLTRRLKTWEEKADWIELFGGWAELVDQIKDTRQVESE